MPTPVNRYYNPSEGVYRSQYIPTAVPAELMLQGLANKEKQYQQQAQNNQLLGDWTQPALPGEDTRYVQNLQKDIRTKLDSWQNADLASPEFQRDYLSFTRQLKDNKDLQSIQKSYTTHQAFLKNQKDYKTGAVTDYDEALADEYMRAYQQYTADEGKGFRGDISLADSNILKGTDIQKATEELFDQIKADGSESLRDFNGISYENGYRGISGKKLDEAAQKQLSGYIESRAGQQLGARYDASHIPQGMTKAQYLRSLSDEDKSKYENNKINSILDYVKGVGSTFKFSDTSTGLAEAKNQARREERELAQQFVQSPEIEVIGDPTTPNINSVKNTQQSLAENSQRINSLSTQNNVFNTLSKMYDGSPGNATIQNYLEHNPQYKSLIEGVNINNPQEFKSFLTNRIKENNDLLFKLNTVNKSIVDTFQDAIAKTFGNRKHTFEESNKYVGEVVDGKIVPLSQSKDKTTAQILDEVRKTSYDNPKVATWKNDLDRIPDKASRDKYVLNLATSGQIGKFSNLLTDYNKVRNIEEEVKGNKFLTMLVDEEMTNGAYGPVAVAKDPSKTVYNQRYQLNENTGVMEDRGPSTIKKVATADNILENIVKGNTTSYDVWYNGRILDPNNPEDKKLYPNPSTLKMNSVYRGETLGGPTASFSGKAYGSKEVTYYDKADGTKGTSYSMSPPEQHEYVIVAKDGAPGYKKAKAEEAYNNFKINPNSDAGRRSYTSYVAYSNPEFANHLEKINNLNKDNKIDSPINLQGNNMILSTKKVNDGTREEYIITLTDPKGQNNNASYRVKDLEEYSKIYSQLVNLNLAE